MLKNTLLLLCLCCLLGCQDTKSKKDSSPNSRKVQQENNLLHQKTQNPRPNSPPYLGLDTLRRVDQTHLKPFLRAYGKKHPATRVLIATKFGDITIKLFKDTPLHRANFIRMTRIGYFNTTYFYRVIEGFMIQGGNSDNKSTARFRKALGKFLIPNEIGKHTHNYGAVAMAKYAKRNVSKASSPYEFFIVVNKHGEHRLDAKFTVFGKVVKGMEVVEKISKVKTGAEDWPQINIPMTVKVLK